MNSEAMEKCKSESENKSDRALSNQLIERSESKNTDNELFSAQRKTEAPLEVEENFFSG